MRSAELPTASWPIRRARPAAAGGRGAALATLTGGDWGWLPLLALVGAIGLLLIALGFTGARSEGPWAAWGNPLFWAGLILLFAPIALRILGTGAARRERIGLVVLFGLGLYLVKMLRYPTMFALHDEFLHWRTAADIARTGDFFTTNPLLPVSALFPGLETITVGLTETTGLSLFAAGTIVLGTTRLMFCLALFLLYEQVGRSARLAGIATLLYLINPKLIFFDAQFSYESLAFPLTALLLFLLARRARAGGGLGPTLAALPIVGTLVITHHLTSYATVLFLLLWSAFVGGVALVGRRPRPLGGPGGMALLAAVLCVAWLIYVSTLVVGYLAPNIAGAVREMLQLIGGEAAGRELFRDPTGRVAPLWERATGFASTLLIVFGLPFGLYQIWRRYRSSALALTFALVSLAYPASLTLRFTQAGGETSDRAAGALFFAIAFVLAAAVTRPARAGGPARARRLGLVALATVLFVGEVIVGSGPSWMRLPGPYLVSSDARSIEPRGLAAAAWARERLGPGNRVATDRINGLLLGSYGEQRNVTHASTGIDVSPLFFADGFGPVQREIIRRGQIRYVVVDRRLSTALPGVGIYFEAPEDGANRHVQPVSLAALEKFSRLVGVSLLYDGGDIAIYEIGAGSREP